MSRRYQICIANLLDETWKEWFDGLSLTLNEDGTTLLTGVIDDPAVLHTVLNNIRNLNLDLVSVSYTEVAEDRNGEN